MAHAYTPGLKVTERTVVRRVRRLPIPGDVLVKVGDKVAPDTVVARTKLPGNPVTINVANIMGMPAEYLAPHLVKKVGEAVAKDEVIAKSISWFGLSKVFCRAPVSGTLQSMSPVTGQAIIREADIPLDVSAYVHGTIVEVIAGEGVVVETEGAFIQGIFGVGGETSGTLRVAVSAADEPLEARHLTPEHAGDIVVGGSVITGRAIKRAIEVGAKGLVGGGIIDTDLINLLGYDIGVAITGQEDIALTIIVTEGFGQMNMADKTFSLFKQLEGKFASVNGATQIRAGVMRPEVIVPGHMAKGGGKTLAASEGLVPGTTVRIIREPYFGALAQVVELPPELQVIETEAKVRILRARLPGGEVVTIPRANVEILEG